MKGDFLFFSSSDFCYKFQNESKDYIEGTYLFVSPGA